MLHQLQIRMENPSYPSTRFGVRVPSIGLHFSPARYHRLMQVVKIFEGEESEKSDSYRPWTQTDFEGWLSHLSRKVRFFVLSCFGVLLFLPSRFL